MTSRNHFLLAVHCRVTHRAHVTAFLCLVIARCITERCTIKRNWGRRSCIQDDDFACAAVAGGTLYWNVRRPTSGQCACSEECRQDPSKFHSRGIISYSVSRDVAPSTSRGVAFTKLACPACGCPGLPDRISPAGLARNCAIFHLLAVGPSPPRRSVLAADSSRRPGPTELAP